MAQQPREILKRIRDTLRLPPALTWALTISLAALLMAVAGVSLAWRALRSESVAYIHQSIGETAGRIARHVQMDLGHRAAYMEQWAAERGQDLAARAAAREAAAKKGEKWALSRSPSGAEVDLKWAGSADWLDLSLWELPDLTDHDLSPRRTWATIQREAAQGDGANEILATENTERQWIEAAFRGQRVVRGSQIQPWGGVVLIVLPLGRGADRRVVSGHFTWHDLSTSLKTEALVQALVVDESGFVLANADKNWVRTRKNLSQWPLHAAFRGNRAPSGQMSFGNEEGKTLFGGFWSLNDWGRVAVMTSVPEEWLATELNGVRNRVLLELGVFFALLVSLVYAWAQRRAISGGLGLGLFGAMKSEVEPALHSEANDKSAFEPSKRTVVVLWGTVRGLEALVDHSTPDVVAQGVNEFYAVVEHVIRKFEGEWERVPGGGFLAHWGARGTDGGEVWKALRCALEIRQDFRRWNEARKIDGDAPWLLGLSVHSGAALAAKLGGAEYKKLGLLGEVLRTARALEHLGEQVGADLLVSQEVWQASEAKFIGEMQGEAKLSPGTGLQGYYRIKGYRDEQGIEVDIPETTQVAIEASADSPLIATVAPTERRWLINNGSQIMGPLTPREVAERLFAQEIDFDCECWAEGTGQSAHIATAGIFTGSGEEGATLWIFDGTTLHGPVSRGFIRTALMHGALTPEAYVCESSTVQGWRKLADVTAGWEEKGSRLGAA